MRLNRSNSVLVFTQKISEVMLTLLGVAGATTRDKISYPVFPE